MPGKRTRKRSSKAAAAAGSGAQRPDLASNPVLLGHRVSIPAAPVQGNDKNSGPALSKKPGAVPGGSSSPRSSSILLDSFPSRDLLLRKSPVLIPMVHGSGWS